MRGSFLITLLFLALAFGDTTDRGFEAPGESEVQTSGSTKDARNNTSKDAQIDVSGIWVVENNVTSFSCDLDDSHSELLHPIGLTPSFLISQSGSSISGAPFDPDAISTVGEGEITGNSLVYNLSVLGPSSSEAETEYSLTFTYSGEVCFDEGGNICSVQGVFEGTGSGEFPDFSEGEPTTVFDSCSWDGTFTAWVFPLPFLDSSLTVSELGGRSAIGGETLHACPLSELILAQRIETGGETPNYIAEVVAEGMEFVWTDTANPGGISLDEDLGIASDSGGVTILGEFEVGGPDEGMLTVTPIRDGEDFS
ncbi:MAG: hypothetical protein NUW37_20335, partial [Planctomycetes bacterium]|nr:hypothetical protein [Planctomycetota bacterium]